jgi:hypothetical protein
MGPESKSLFTAAEKGDWSGVFDSLAAMHKAARERQGGKYQLEFASGLSRGMGGSE